MKKRFAYIGILLLISLVLASALEALQLWSQPPFYESEPRIVQEAVSLDFAQAELTNAEISGDTLKTKGEGAVILFRFDPPETLSRLSIESKKHIRSTIPVRIYLSADGETFSESDMIEIEAVPESLTWTAEFPEKQYAALKIETDGKISVRSLNCRDAVTEKAAIRESPRLWRIAVMTLLLFFCLWLLRWFNALSHLKNSIRNTFSFLKKNRRMLPLRFVLFLLSGVLGYAVVRWLVAGSLSARIDIPRQLFCLSSGISAAVLLNFRKTLSTRPEKLFVVFCLLTGVLMVCLFPNDALVNGDAEYHFDQALKYSYLGEDRSTDADNEFIAVRAAGGDDSFDWDTRMAYQQMQQQRYLEGANPLGYPGVMLNSVYEIFAGAGLFTGRVLHLSWSWILYLGKLFNLLAYSACGYLAIRRLKAGKMLLSCLLLIPANVFLASCFSYDPGVTGFLSLSMSYYFAEWQEPNRKLTYRHAFVILFSAAIALLTKAFYAPVLLITLLMPREKWASGREECRQYVSRRCYLLLVCCVILISLVPYILPLFQGVVTSGMRGETSTEPIEQFRYILSDPLNWFRIMFGFQREYFNPANSADLFTRFEYQGTGPYWQALNILFVLLAFTDKKECDRALERRPLIRISALLLLYLTTCIICLCLYLTYTPIGAASIYGVNPRYLLPILFPVLMCFGSGFAAWLLRINRNWKQCLYNGIAFTISLVVLYCTVYANCVGKF